MCKGLPGQLDADAFLNWMHQNIGSVNATEKQWVIYFHLMSQSWERASLDFRIDPQVSWGIILTRFQLIGTVLSHMKSGVVVQSH